MKKHLVAIVALVSLGAACGNTSDTQSSASSEPVISETTAVPAVSEATAVPVGTSAPEVSTTVLIQGDEPVADEPVADEPVADAPVASTEEADQVVAESVAEVWEVEAASVECLMGELGGLAAEDVSPETVTAATIEAFAACGLSYEELLAAGAFDDLPDDLFDADQSEIDELVIAAIAEALGTEPENVVCLMDQLDLSDPQALVDELDSSELILMMVRCGIDVSSLATGQ